MYKIILTLLKNRGEIRKKESIIKHVRKYNLMLYTFMHDASFIILYKITNHFFDNQLSSFNNDRKMLSSNHRENTEYLKILNKYIYIIYIYIYI